MGQLWAFLYPLLDEPPARSGFFGRLEIEQLASELPDYFKNVLRFAYITGWRAREVTTRKWSHVDLDAGWRGEGRKGQEGRETANGGGQLASFASK